MSRDAYLAMLPVQPLLAGDALVVLCGEDAKARADIVPHLLLRNAAHQVVLSGGRNEPPRIQNADAIFTYLVGKGVAPSAITLEAGSLNTREQAVNTLAIATERGWTRLLLCVSPQHAYRAHLTFIQRLIELGLDPALHVLTVPALGMPWCQSPPGCAETRCDLLAAELAKITEYQALGHVASYEQGVAYLKLWERR